MTDDESLKSISKKRVSNVDVEIKYTLRSDDMADSSYHRRTRTDGAKKRSLRKEFGGVH